MAEVQRGVFLKYCSKSSCWPSSGTGVRLSMFAASRVIWWAAAEWEVSRKPCPESSSNLALLDSPANCAALSPLEGLNRENDIECGERKACFLSGSKFHYVKFNKV